MTQVYLSVGIILTITLLVCYLFIRQTITKRKKNKLRLHRVLDKRAVELLQVLNAFPTNFLPKDLQVFLYRCIVDTFEQLAQLSPDEPKYLEHLKTYSASMEAIMRASPETNETSLQQTNQINEMRKHLSHLEHFIKKWKQIGNLNEKQYSHYKELLKQLLTQLMVDNYVLLAKQSVRVEKTTLAIHYYVLAKNLLVEGGLEVSKKSYLATINKELNMLEKKAEKEITSNVTLADITENKETSSVQYQWQECEEDDFGKKKSVYD